MGIRETFQMSTPRACELELLLENKEEDVINYDAVDKTLTLSLGEIKAPDEEPTSRGFRCVLRCSTFFKTVILLIGANAAAGRHCGRMLAQAGS